MINSKTMKILMKMLTIVCVIAMFMSAAPAVHADEETVNVTVEIIHGTYKKDTSNLPQGCTINEDKTYIDCTFQKGIYVSAQSNHFGRVADPDEGYNNSRFMVTDNGVRVKDTPYYPASGTVEWYESHFNNGVNLNGSTMASDRAFKIEYFPNKYTIKFDGNGATGGSMSDKNMEYDQELALPECGFTYEDKVFMGWNTESDGSGKAYQDGETIKNLMSEDDSSITLYAQWGTGKVTIIAGNDDLVDDLAETLGVKYPYYEKGEGSLTFFHDETEMTISDMQKTIGAGLGFYEGRYAICVGRNEQSEYADQEELEEEYYGSDETLLPDEQTFHVIWYDKATKGSFTVENPECGKQIKLIEEGDTFPYQENGPAISEKEGSQLMIYDNFIKPSWIDPESEAIFDIITDETIFGDETYQMGLLLRPKFGYYIDEEDTPEIEIENGSDIETSLFGDGSFMFVKAFVEALHPYGKPEYIWADDYSTVTGKVVCTADESHVLTETVDVTKDETPPTCEELGKNVYTSGEFGNKEFGVQVKEENTGPLGHDYGDWEVIKEPTDEEYGLKRRYCRNDPDHVEEESISPLWYYYEVVEGFDESWVKGSKDPFRAVMKRTLYDEKTYGLFKALYIDGIEEEIPEEAYEATEGSLIIKLDPGYLEKLSEGKHYLTAEFSDGWFCTCPFTIIRKSEPSTNRYVQPKTGVE